MLEQAGVWGRASERAGGSSFNTGEMVHRRQAPGLASCRAGGSAPTSCGMEDRM